MKSAAVCLFLVLLPTLFVSGLHAQVSMDPSAVFKTAVAQKDLPVAASPVHTGAAKQLSPSPNTTFGGTPFTVGPVVTPTTSVPEAEEHIAVDPINSSALVAAISDFSLRGGFNTTKYAFSLSNGASGNWTQRFVPRNSAGLLLTSDGHTWQANSDPVVALDKLGNVYLADLYLAVSSSGKVTNDGLYVSVANVTSGVKFTASSTRPVLTHLSATSTDEDKPWITVDNSGNASTTGNVYVAWAHFTSSTDTIVFSRSTNQGQSWSAPIQINPGSQNGAVQGAQVAVGPNGEVYVAYEVFFVGNTRQIFLAKSTNGGTSFATPVAITPFFNELTFHSTYRKNSFPALAVNPQSGFEYVLYADQPSNSLGAQVEFVGSKTAGGTTFTPPQTINDSSTGQQFFPAITVDASSGTIAASWFDTRKNSGTSLYDIFATRSTNNGGIWAPNSRVTPTSINAGSASFIGDYAGIAALGGFAHPVWTSGGFNNGHLQTSTLH